MLKKWQWIVASSALCVAAAGGLALAKGHDPAKQAAVMQKFDVNGDGALDDTERTRMRAAFAAKHAARKAARIARFDADRDGALSPAERAVMQDELARERFGKLDANGDGKLSLDEFKAGRTFSRGSRGSRGSCGGHGGRHEAGKP
jgi:hypothetical protein